MRGLKKLINGCFAGYKSPMTRILVQADDATSPDTVVTAPKGVFLVIDYDGDDSDNDAFINTDGSTAWTQIHNNA